MNDGPALRPAEPALARVPSRVGWIRRWWGKVDTPHIVSAVLLLILVGTLVVLGWKREQSARITGRLVARSVSFTLAEPLDIEVAVDFDPPEAGLSSFSSGQPLDVPPGTTVAGLRVEAAKMRLVGLHVAEGGSLELSLSPGPKRQLRILAGGGSGLALDASWPVVLTMGRAGPRSFGPPDPGPVTVEAEPGHAVPLRLEAALPVPPTPTTALPGQASQDLTDVLDDASVRSLRFGRANAVVLGRPFVSSIVDGQVTLVDTTEQLALEPGAPLSLEGFYGHIVSVGIGTDGFHVTFTGEAGRVKIGPVGFVEDRTPTLLEAASHVRWIQLLCGALVGVGGSFATLMIPGLRRKEER